MGWPANKPEFEGAIERSRVDRETNAGDVTGHGGFEVVKQYVLRTMTPKIEAIAADTHQQNFKAVLQQHAQKTLGATPVYDLMDEKGPDHSKCFEVCVVIDGKRYASAWGPNKKSAEQKAALNALEELGVLKSPEMAGVSANGTATQA